MYFKEGYNRDLQITILQNIDAPVLAVFPNVVLATKEVRTPS